MFFSTIINIVIFLLSILAIFCRIKIYKKGMTTKNDVKNKDGNYYNVVKNEDNDDDDIIIINEKIPSQTPSISVPCKHYKHKKVPFFYIFTTPNRGRSKSLYQQSNFFDIVSPEPPFLNLIKSVEQYHINSEKIVAAMVSNAETAKRSEWAIFDHDNHLCNKRNIAVPKEEEEKNIHILSLKLEEKARRTAELLEKNYFVLKELLTPFHVVYGLPAPPPLSSLEPRRDGYDGPGAPCSSEGESSSKKTQRGDFFHNPRRGRRGATNKSDFYDDDKADKRTNSSASYSLSSYDSALQILTHIVRDWSTLGQRIRDNLFDWVIEQLLLFHKTTGATTNRDGKIIQQHTSKPILVPGAGLGRLAFEINKKGFHVEANEISIVMSAAAYRFLNADCDHDCVDYSSNDERKVNDSSCCCLSPLYGEIFPFVDDFTVNEVNSEFRYQSVTFEGVTYGNSSSRSMASTPSSGTGGSSLTDNDNEEEEQEIDCRQKRRNNDERNHVNDEYSSLSYTIGDFIQIYSTADKVGQYGSVVTCFFIDTATNIYEYILIIRNVLEDGGQWINVGPLQWHGNSKLHLSGDELRMAIETMGFSIESWEVDEEAINYRHDDLNEQPRYTKYEGYKPIRFVATLTTSTTQ